MNQLADRPQRDDYDVVVVGGGPAGLSAALTLARARRSVLVVDAEDPRNGPAEGVHGLLGLDGIAPGDLADKGRAEVRHFGGEVLTGRVESARSPGAMASASVWTVADRYERAASSSPPG